MGFDRIISCLFSVLSSFPDYSSEDLKILLVSPRTRKIASRLSEGKVRDLSAEDFAAVSRKGGVLYNCGFYLMNYGKEYGNRDFLNLALGLFVEGRKLFWRPSRGYALALNSEVLLGRR